MSQVLQARDGKSGSDNETPRPSTLGQASARVMERRAANNPSNGNENGFT
jgi:hypothetical protein